MLRETGWSRWGRYAAATVVASLIGWRAFLLGEPVPLLDQFDLGIHELGHLLAAFAPRMLMFLAGSVLQVLVPTGLAWYFWRRQRDPAGTGFCLAWAGASVWDVSVYIADAPIQSLPLVGGGQHDWAYLLGPQGWDALHLAGDVAATVEYVGGAMAGAGVVVAVVALGRGLWSRPLLGRSNRDPVGSVTGALGPAGGDPWAEAAKLPLKHEAA